MDHFLHCRINTFIMEILTGGWTVAVVMLTFGMKVIRCDECVYQNLTSGKFADCSNRNLTCIPDNISNDTTVLDLSQNKIEKVPNDIFAHLSDLKQLNLSVNRIAILEINAFKGLNKLMTLSLSYINLTVTDKMFHPYLFAPLNNLRELYIDNDFIHNNWTYLDETIGLCSKLEMLSIPGLSNTSFGPRYDGLLNLRSLVLSSDYCNMTFVRTDTFSHTLHLRQLTLARCKIRKVDPCSFCPLSNLEFLDMSYNAPDGLKLIRNVTYGLQYTNVTNLTFTNMEDPHSTGKMITRRDLEFCNNTKIKFLDMSSNMIETYEEGSINYFPQNLEEVDVSDNRPIFGGYLIQIYSLQHLRVFRADYLNKYHDFDDSNHQISLKRKRASSGYVKQMDGLHHKISLRIPPKLEELYCRYSLIPYDIPEYNFVTNNSLRHIELNHNSLSKWIGPLSGLDKLEYVDLSVNLCDNISDNFFSGLTSIRTLRARANFIGYVIENNRTCPWIKPLRNLQTLDLYLNKIRVLPAKCFSTLVNLENLNLTENSISDWEMEIGHMPNISTIDLSGNNIDGFPKATRDHLTEVAKRRRVYINLKGNALECKCENIEFLEWLYTVNITFVDREKYTCRDNNWRILNLTDIQHIISELNKNCADYTYLNTVLSVLIGCFLLVVMYGIYCRYKWKLGYIYYTTFGRYQMLKEDDGESYRYDAYISYSEDDQWFAVEKLARKLGKKREEEAEEEEGTEEEENNLHGLSLYLFERDCRAGHYENATIVNKIENSRKTVILFTKSYAKNQRCLFELNMAGVKQLYRAGADQSIHLVQLESMPYKDIPLEILKLFQSGCYIEYPNDPQGNSVFWKRLRNIIKPLSESEML